MIARVCIAGFTTRHVASSAYRAGYAVYAVDHFCDLDLGWYTADRARFEEIDEIPDAVAGMIEKYRIDLLVVTSGAETISAPLPLCGTPRERVGRFLDKLETARFFAKTDVPTPRIVPEGTYPAMWKPRKGSGGYRNAIVRSESELASWKEANEGIPSFGQEVVEGMPASVCCLTNGESAVAVAANEQLLRGGSSASFGFSGSVTPLDHPLSGSMAESAERIAAASGCLGTIGVDFVLGDEAYAIEVNPRFQGTLDTVELSTGCNLFSLHVGACSGILPEKRPRPVKYAARGIVFAGNRTTIQDDLSGLSPGIADIPWPGTTFDEGEAVVSVLGWGATREEAVAMLDTNKRRVRQYIR
ncbi:MAG: ATP-grasp domain-containing protein [Methanoregulaceae archaeon]|nr:ATP-grasp domain-containing protein [Methanoregulaceae archaeon]